ncbi:MAG: anthranilate phosphoribosyltransferase [Nitrosopumilus sp. B06]|nr:MAG: anthranilate phosphoribosyltransferase [Nitrosopumilus sp. D6]RNJ80694.1 MAG: anthranilate phosphoribosyltransferase [Nitrosopumilus sp. B06]
MISELVTKLQGKKDLTYDEMCMAMTEILAGNITTGETADFVAGLAEKGETDDELLAMLEKMQEASLGINATGAIDMCGTGGDGQRTFNVSTAASFMVAAAGGRVAKHGNYSSSGATGSADMFEYFGYDLNQEPGQVESVLERHGICFIFAQKFHPAMRHVAEARRQIGKKTAFNMLGPLSNPARVKNQLVGVSCEEHLHRLPAILGKRGGRKIMAVRSADGMDELSTSSANTVCVVDEEQTIYSITPEEAGLHRSSPRDIQVKDKAEAVSAFARVLAGTANRAMIETAAFNAGGGLVVAGITDSICNGVQLALDTIKDGRAYRLLENFVRDTGDIVKLEEVLRD